MVHAQKKQLTKFTTLHVKVHCAASVRRIARHADGGSEWSRTIHCLDHFLQGSSNRALLELPPFLWLRLGVEVPQCWH